MSTLTLPREALEAMCGEQTKFLYTRFSESEKMNKTIANYIFEYKTKRNKTVQIVVTAIKQSDSITISMRSTSSSQEIRIKGSELAHAIIEQVKALPEVRLRLIMNQGYVGAGAGVEDVQKYKEQQQKRRSGNMTKSEVLALENEILSFYNQLKQKQLPDVHEDLYESSILLVKGRETKYLIENILVKHGIATSTPWHSSQKTIRLNMDGFQSPGKAALRAFCDKLKELQFTAYIHTWYD